MRVMNVSEIALSVALNIDNDVVRAMNIDTFGL